MRNSIASSDDTSNYYGFFQEIQMREIRIKSGQNVVLDNFKTYFKLSQKNEGI